MIIVNKARLADADSIVAVDCSLSGTDVRTDGGKVQKSLTYYILAEDYAGLELVQGPLDPDMRSELERLDGRCRAVRTARRLLEFGSNTESGLVSKLRARGFSKEEAAFAAQLCTEQGCIDEKSDAVRKAELEVKKGRGRLRVIAALRAKGYTGAAIDAAEDYLDTVDFADVCAKAIAAKWRVFPAEPDERRKALASLARLGFTPSDIRRALNK